MEEEEEEERRRKRLEEMRRRLNTDEIEENPGGTGGEEGSPSDSQTSSVEGLYGATSGRTSHPFKVVDHDTVSMQSGVSVGRMGRILVSNPGVSSSISNNPPSSSNFPSNSNNYTFQQQIPSSASMNLSPAGSSTPKPSHHYFQQSSSFQPQSTFMTNNTNNNNHTHHHHSQLNHLHSSSNTTSSSSSVSSSEQVPSVISTAKTTVPANFSTERLDQQGNSPPSETSSNCSSGIFNNTNSISTFTHKSILSGGKSSAPEPDLVASCTSSATNNNHNKFEGSVAMMGAPVAPPRRKRKGLLGKTLSEDGEGGSLKDFPITRTPKDFIAQQQGSVQSLPRRPSSARFDSPTSSTNASSLPSPNPPSPTVSIRSICRELDKTLGETNTQSKIFVVKAQDEEKTRAKSSGPKVLRRTESLPKDVVAAFDPSGTGSGGYRDSSSGSSTLTSSTVTTTASTSMNPGGDVVDSAIIAIQEKVVVSATAEQPPYIPSNVRSSGSRSNSAPKSGSHQLAAIISAMAIEGDRRDTEMEKEKTAQFNLMIRTRTDSGKLLSDLEILEQVQVRTITFYKYSI
jgi:hypothetical protein